MERPPTHPGLNCLRWVILPQQASARVGVWQKQQRAARPRPWHANIVLFLRMRILNPTCMGVRVRR